MQHKKTFPRLSLLPTALAWLLAGPLLSCGAPEPFELTGIRAFSAYSGATPPSTGSNLDWGWYKQTWVRWKHKEIGNPYTEPSSSDQPRVIAQTLDAQLTWLAGLL